MTLISKTLFVTLFALASLTTATAADDADKIKKIVDSVKDTIVQVEIVWDVKITYKGQEQPSRETKVTRNGVVINEDGLTILSSSGVTPMASSKQKGVSIQCDPQSVKFILADSTEIEAEIALKDKDLDIIYVKPAIEPDDKFAFLKLDKTAKVNVLDKIVTLSRMGTDADRAVMYYQETVHGIIEKPRKYYVASHHGPSMPAFTMDGKCFGLFLKRKGSGSFYVLPAEDILESAAQVTDE